MTGSLELGLLAVYFQTTGTVASQHQPVFILHASIMQHIASRLDTTSVSKTIYILCDIKNLYIVATICSGHIWSYTTTAAATT